ncbi:MAG: formylglycine-generating enzyme family protein [Gemmataceae bacterium]|nr:formylglycine-generating enzyme family protein [Gemmataceae bacterium]
MNTRIACMGLLLGLASVSLTQQESNNCATAAPIRKSLDPNADDNSDAWLIKNSIGMELVRIQPGTFLMGSPAGEANRSAIEAPHEVEISKPFYMGKFSVTQEQYLKVIGKNPSAFCAEGTSKNSVMGLDTKRFPVEMVSWVEAKEYCRKLTQLERAAGRITASMEYTLPTEAEWEYACRAGTRTTFNCGPTLSVESANHGERKLQRPMDVGSFKPNAWGLYDMHGNVCQWCEDWYDPKYYPVSRRQDPQGGQGNIRVLRGGSWIYSPNDCRAANRDGIGANHHGHSIGFRVVRRVSPQPR